MEKAHSKTLGSSGVGDWYGLLSQQQLGGYGWNTIGESMKAEPHDLKKLTEESWKMSLNPL